MDEKIVLIDGHSILNRAFYGIPLLTNGEGMRTNAIYGFLNILFKVLEEEQADYLAVAFDLHAPTFRHKLYDAYKGTRHAMPDDLRMQVPVMKEMLTAMGVPLMMLEGYEADDLLGTVSRQMEEKGLTVRIISGDRDLLQLASEKTMIRIPKTRQGKTEVENYLARDVMEKYQVSPLEFIDLKALMGDSSDNIPGIPGVGEKTAAKIISSFHSIENAHEHLDEIMPKKAQNALREHWDLAVLSKTLATIDRHAKTEDGNEFSISLDDARLKPAFVNLFSDEALRIAKRLELRTIVERFLAAEGSAKSSSDKNTDADNFRLVYMKSEADELVEKASGNEIGIHILAEDGVFYGAAVSFEDETVYSRNISREQIQKIVKAAKAVDAIHLKEQLFALDDGSGFCRADEEKCFDAAIGAYLINPLAGEYSYDNISKDFTGRMLESRSELLGKSSIKKLIDAEADSTGKKPTDAGPDSDAKKPTDAGPDSDAKKPTDAGPECGAKKAMETGPECGAKKLIDAGPDSAGNGNNGSGNDGAASGSVPALWRYACFQALTARSCRENMQAKLKELGMLDLFNDMEMPLLFVLYRMEKAGIEVKADELSEYGKKLGGRISDLEKEIWKAAGKEFNINSPKQLGVILFEEMGLPGGKKTKTGYSTAADVLEKLSESVPMVADILEYRQLTKLRSTYAEGLSAFISDDGRIHGRFHQTVTATGRLSSADPNLQNIPVRTELGRELRKVFVPQEGYLFLDADYSQIELRVLAHVSGDDKLIEAYNSAEDIHAVTASQVFHVPLSEVTPQLRRNAKAVNFGIVYGISSFGLSQGLSISRQEAQDYIEQYFKTYPSIKGYLDGCVRSAKELGYSVTLFGRRRPVPELKESNFMRRSFGERVAMNAPIQGTAADIIKIAMIGVDRALREEGLKSRLVLQVHDELLIETAKGEEERVKEIMADKMTGAARLRVKLEIDMNEGGNWYEAH